MCRNWGIATKAGWLIVEDKSSLTVIECDRIALFGTTTGGFAVTAAGERMFFECKAAHAKDCVARLIEVLT